MARRNPRQEQDSGCIHSPKHAPGAEVYEQSVCVSKSLSDSIQVDQKEEVKWPDLLSKIG